MSAAAQWEALAPAPSSAPSATRPRLVLLPGGPSAAPDTRRRAARPRLRLTRRGRLALTTAAAVLLVLVGALVASKAAIAGAEPAVTHRVAVPAGSTLSQIAARELPDRPVAQAVIDLQRANGLASSEVSAGQVLLVPGR